mmetsp:Transcript_8177/g.19753  ORF Transcript_8177/g.19753 Transcript_8177/m.19753 type:complete len:236 (-) Transcript_8177:1216-1923(-)
MQLRKEPLLPSPRSERTNGRRRRSSSPGTKSSRSYTPSREAARPSRSAPRKTRTPTKARTPATARSCAAPPGTSWKKWWSGVSAWNPNQGQAVWKTCSCLRLLVPCWKQYSPCGPCCLPCSMSANKSLPPRKNVRGREECREPRGPAAATVVERNATRIRDSRRQRTRKQQLAVLGPVETRAASGNRYVSPRSQSARLLPACSEPLPPVETSCGFAPPLFSSSSKSTPAPPAPPR